MAPDLGRPDSTVVYIGFRNAGVDGAWRMTGALLALTTPHKHGVSFDEAATVFADPLSLTIVDEAHADVEDRFIDIGESSSGRLLVVVYSEHDETIRIISCRPATSAERRTYEQQTI